MYKHTGTNWPQAASTYKNTKSHVQAHGPMQIPHRLLLTVTQTGTSLLSKAKAALMLLLPDPAHPGLCSLVASHGFWEQLCLVGTELEASSRLCVFLPVPSHGSPPQAASGISWTNRLCQQLWHSTHSPRCSQLAVSLQCLRRDHGHWGKGKLPVSKPCHHLPQVHPGANWPLESHLRSAPLSHWELELSHLGG